MDLAVVLGQDLAEAARPVRDGAAADLAARDRKTGNGHGETAGTGLAHRFHHASPARLTLRPPRAGRAADSGPVDSAGPGSYRPTPRRRLSSVERPGRPWLPARRPMQRCRASQLRRRSREISSPSQRQKSTPQQVPARPLVGDLAVRWQFRAQVIPCHFQCRCGDGAVALISVCAGSNHGRVMRWLTLSSFIMLDL
jgi:hypothetical protein